MEKFEFMSPEWLQMAREQIGAALEDKKLDGIQYTLCERFTNPPAHLRRGTAPDITFHVRIDNGKVDVGDGDMDADVTIVSDYADALEVARDPDSPAADPQAVQERPASGRMQIIGNPADAPKELLELDIHRLLASRTK